MLEFIVLGLVPGTHIQLTLTGVLIVMLAAVLLPVTAYKVRDELHHPIDPNLIAIAFLAKR